MSAHLAPPTPTDFVLRKAVLVLGALGTSFVIIVAAMGYPMILLSAVAAALSLAMHIPRRKLEERKKAWALRLSGSLEIFIAFVYLGSQMPLWFGLKRVNLWADNYRYGEGMEGGYQRLMFATYASSFFLANMAIHYWFGLTTLYRVGPTPQAVRFYSGYGFRCPNCAGSLPAISMGKKPVDNDARHPEVRYSLLGAQEEGVTCAVSNEQEEGVMSGGQQEMLVDDGRKRDEWLARDLGGRRVGREQYFEEFFDAATGLSTGSSIESGGSG